MVAAKSGMSTMYFIAVSLLFFCGSVVALYDALEPMSNFLARLFRVIDGNVLTFFGRARRVTSNALSSVDRGVIRNFERFLGAIGGLYPHPLCALAPTPPS